jgi:hypothetical protein
MGIATVEEKPQDIGLVHPTREAEIVVRGGRVMHVVEIPI